MATRVGFIGLGDMGKGMAKNLVRKGFDLTVYDIREEPVKELIALGAKPANSPRELATASDVVFIMVRDDAQAQEAVLGKDGLFKGMGSGSTLVITSTLSPSLCQKLAKEGAKHNIGVVDTPVSGAKAGAEAGTLTLTMGGDEALLKKLEPVLSAISANRFYLGAIGMGQVGKLANNMVLFASLASTAEGIAFAVKAGIPVKTFLAFLNVSTGCTWVSQRWDAVASLKKDKSSSATLRLMYRDLNLGLGYARELGVDLPLVSGLDQLDLWREVS